MDMRAVTRRRFVGIGAAAVVCCHVDYVFAATQRLGKFEGSVIAEWLPDGRNMKLVKPFGYVSSDGRKWPVPSAVVVDGASIPSAFWSIIGGPFDGLYRGPSVIHDYYCEVQSRPYEEVHSVFYEAMLTSGVGQKRAWLMYQAVLRFGPRWEDPSCKVVDENYDFEKCARNSAKTQQTPAEPTREQLANFAEQMEAEADAVDIEKLRRSIDL